MDFDRICTENALLGLKIEHCYALLPTLYIKVQATNIHVADVGRVGGHG